MKFLIGLFASISSLFFSQTNKPDGIAIPPLNTAIISFHDTYYLPAIADPDNFPKVKSVVLSVQNTKAETKTTIKTEEQVVAPQPAQPTPPPLPPPPPPPASVVVDTGDPYIPKNTLFIDQSTQWLKMDFSLNGSIYDNSEHSLSNVAIDREYWKVDAFAYWAPGVIPPRPPLEKDYFKLEIYEEVTNKLIYTMTSGSDENFHGSQIFKKAGKYTFKTSSKPNGQYEVTFLVSPTLAK